jgi:hypothetical protein
MPTIDANLLFHNSFGLRKKELDCYNLNTRNRNQHMTYYIVRFFGSYDLCDPFLAVR